MQLKKRKKNLQKTLKPPAQFSIYGIITVMISLVFFITIGYSAMATQLNISGDANFRVDADIRIVDHQFIHGSNGGGILYNPNFSKNTIITGVYLPNEDSTATFEVTVTNFTNIPMTLSEINDIHISNSNIVYTINNIAIDDQINGFETVTFTITFYYSPELEFFPRDRYMEARIEFNFIISRTDVTLSFNANGADAIGAQTLTCSFYFPETNCIITAPTITRAGYNIVGWHTNPNATTSTWNVGTTRSVSTNETWYAITVVQPPSLRNRILYYNPIRTGANFSIVANNENRATQEGLFSINDIHGTSHFFRGTHYLNNNVIFAGFQWKILRIDGNGNVRLIYNGLCPNNTCSIQGNTGAAATAIGPNAFNTQGNHNRFIGYMFGSETGTFNQQHANTYNSNIKTVLDNWLNSNITGTNRTLVANNTPFCADRSLGTQAAQNSWPGGLPLTANSGTGTLITAYGGADRLHNHVSLSNFEPSLICPRPGDTMFLPIGLITADEVALAGARFGFTNTDFFLRNNTWWWTMTPARFNGTLAMPFHVTINGELNVNTGVTSTPQTRPVISLNENALVTTGNGSATNPFRVVP